MSQNFRPDTQGWEVVEWFPLRVKHKTCEAQHDYSRKLKLTSPLYAVVLSGLVRGDLAATTADALAHGGAGCIIFTGRSQPELQTVIDHINRKHPKTKIIFITTDSDKLASMKAAATTIKKLAVPIDGFIGFPTVMAEDWKLTSDGIESHFQKNYLGYFVLINSLLEKMPAGSRVVLMTTCVHQEAPSPKWEDVNFSVRRPICLTKGGGTILKSVLNPEWRNLPSSCRIHRVDVCKHPLHEDSGPIMSRSVHRGILCQSWKYDLSSIDI